MKKHYYMLVEHTESRTDRKLWTAEHERAESFEQAVNRVDETDNEIGYKVSKAILEKETDKIDNRTFNRLIKLAMK